MGSWWGGRGARVGIGAAVLGIAMVASPREARAERRVDHGAAAAGGAVAGLICGGATLTYSRIRAATSDDPPVLWHSGTGPGWIGVFFVEHAAVGGVSGAFGRDMREGFAIGGLVTCGLDVLYLVASEIIAAGDEPSLAALERGPDGRMRWGIPPVVVNRRGAWVSLFAWRF